LQRLGFSALAARRLTRKPTSLMEMMTMLLTPGRSYRVRRGAVRQTILVGDEATRFVTGFFGVSDIVRVEHDDPHATELVDKATEVVVTSELPDPKQELAAGERSFMG
jgi:hypothetical protein